MLATIFIPISSISRQINLVQLNNFSTESFQGLLQRIVWHLLESIRHNDFYQQIIPKNVQLTRKPFPRMNHFPANYSPASFFFFFCNQFSNLVWNLSIIKFMKNLRLPNVSKPVIWVFCLYSYCLHSSHSVVVTRPN